MSGIFPKVRAAAVALLASMLAATAASAPAASAAQRTPPRPTVTVEQAVQYGDGWTFVTGKATPGGYDTVVQVRVWYRADAYVDVGTRPVDDGTWGVLFDWEGSMQAVRATAHAGRAKSRNAWGAPVHVPAPYMAAPSGQ